MEVLDEGKKRQFAAALLRYDDNAQKAALSMFEDTGLALQLSYKWPVDPIVIDEKKRLLAGRDAKEFLPTKEQQAKDIWTMATNALSPDEDRLKAHRLYAEIMGHIEKTPAGGVNILAQGVMIVPAATDANEWEKMAIEQQRELTTGKPTIQ